MALDDTANNPANLYSRGVAPSQVYKSEMWLKGTECTWPAKKAFVKQALDEDASELPPISEINLCVNLLRVVSLKEGALGGGGGGGFTRPIPRDEGADQFCGIPIVGRLPTDGTRGPEEKG